MRPPRDRSARQPVDVSPHTHACPACHPPLKERSPKQRWMSPLDQPVNVGSHWLACWHPEGERRAAVYRPPQEDTLALRGDTFGRAVVARMGALRDRDHWSITKMRGPLQTDSKRSLSLKAVALRCEVLLAWVTPGARQAQARSEPLRRLGGSVRAIDGVHPEKGHEPLDSLRAVRSGRVGVAKMLLSSAPAAMAHWRDEVRGVGLPMWGVIRDPHASSCVAVHHKRPTVPHQIGQEHALKEVAPPVCAADRPRQQELNQTGRGLRALERQADPWRSKEAQVGADSCLAMRPVRREAGQSPLEPPGLPLEQHLPLIAASVERGMTAPPSAWRKR
jgi:hypothetical protein